MSFGPIAPVGITSDVTIRGTNSGCLYVEVEDVTQWGEPLVASGELDRRAAAHLRDLLNEWLGDE